ncbi:hypothetical protein NX869_29570, partial [Burkholderia thailandensis]|nr:hypothetical protein [Burkholderia thailandensis]
QGGWRPGTERVILRTNGRWEGMRSRLTGCGDGLALGDAIPGFGKHGPVSSLPHGVAATHTTKRSAGHYLHVPQTSRHAWRARINRASRTDGRAMRPRIGLCWAGKPTHAEDAARSIPIERLRSLIDRFATQVDWIRIQPGMSVQTPGMCCIDHAIGDFLELAALPDNLHLPITVDSAPVHVAGALGVPAWLMNRHFGDWRWPRQETRSAWYGSVEVFHQATPDDWSGILD